MECDEPSYKQRRPSCFRAVSRCVRAALSHHPRTLRPFTARGEPRGTAVQSPAQSGSVFPVRAAGRAVTHSFSMSAVSPFPCLPAPGAALGVRGSLWSEGCGLRVAAGFCFGEKKSASSFGARMVPFHLESAAFVRAGGGNAAGRPGSGGGEGQNAVIPAQAGMRSAAAAPTG